MQLDEDDELVLVLVLVLVATRRQNPALRGPLKLSRTRYQDVAAVRSAHTGGGVGCVVEPHLDFPEKQMDFVSPSLARVCRCSPAGLSKRRSHVTVYNVVQHLPIVDCWMKGRKFAV